MITYTQSNEIFLGYPFGWNTFTSGTANYNELPKEYQQRIIEVERPKKIKCLYCQSKNNAENDNCSHCGAPLD